MSVRRNPELAFLENCEVIYFAGLDNKALPFHEARQRIQQDSDRNLTYLKVSTLFADHVVVPPTFFLDNLGSGLFSSALIHYLAPFYQSGQLLSPVWNELSSMQEFLELKLRRAVFDMEEAPPDLHVVRTLFHEIPLLHRDVDAQSSGFRTRVFDQLRRLHGVDSESISILGSMLQATEGQYHVPLSRSKAFECLSSLACTQALGRHVIRKLYYAINASYYSQGAATYFGKISLVGSERYSVLGKGLFAGNSPAILIGYDPRLMLTILDCFGITQDQIDRLSTEDILRIKSTHEFRSFRTEYARFAAYLQLSVSEYGDLSKTQLLHLKARIQQRFVSEYVEGLKTLTKRKRRFGLAETAVLAVLTGAVGFFVIPLYGALIGLIPIVLHATDASGKVSDHILARLSRGHQAFHDYVELLHQIAQTAVQEAEATVDTKYAV